MVTSGQDESVLASETIGLMTELGAIKAALASETAIINAVGSVKTAVEGLGDVVLTGENIGLITGLANIKNSTASETVLISELTDVSNEVYINKIALSANTDTTINTGLSGRRLFIEIRGDKEFWINTDAAAAIGNHWRVVGGVGLRINEDCQVHVIASEAVNLFVLEGGRK